MRLLDQRLGHMWPDEPYLAGRRSAEQCAECRYTRYAMGTRGYVVIKLKGSPDIDRLWKLTKQYEEIDGVDFADTVTGNYDFVLTVDTKKAFDMVVHEIKSMAKDAEVLSLQSSNLFDKHREIRDLKLLKDLSG